MPAEEEAGEELSVTARASRAAWARLLAKAYEINVRQCPRFKCRVSIIAAIRRETPLSKVEITHILSHEVEREKPRE